ncbi:MULTISPECIES: response regulator transcription factor [unclassified Actinomyces]|uniref:response regulator transcription factor n=1 Tax=unclassified Actinomyces TaxID=2609248 RepID=UPI0013A6D987|nr:MULTISPECIES: response regulator transcription factor [unclassified Actinomyces]MBW3069397.1 response regulator transcription factor [Actinomyces sp. 594]NDR54782.1 response regulator transcription factor [Actinomyces sp. 565]
MIHVGIVDDDALVRRALTDLLTNAASDDIHVRWAAGDGQDALDILRSDTPDAQVQVLLVDVQMPRLDGIALANIVHRERPEIAILVLTTFVADSVMDRALAAGVRGFIAKEDPVETLAATIRHVAAGNMVLSPSSSSIITGRPERSTAAASASTAPSQPQTTAKTLPPGITLSPREVEVLTLMVEAKTNKQIARALGVSDATVKTHVSALIAKLGVQDRVGAVVYALRAGLV